MAKDDEYQSLYDKSIERLRYLTSTNVKMPDFKSQIYTASTIGSDSASVEAEPDCITFDCTSGTVSCSNKIVSSNKTNGSLSIESGRELNIGTYSTTADWGPWATSVNCGDVSNIVTKEDLDQAIKSIKDAMTDSRHKWTKISAVKIPVSEGSYVYSLETGETMIYRLTGMVISTIDEGVKFTLIRVSDYEKVDMPIDTLYKVDPKTGNKYGVFSALSEDVKKYEDYLPTKEMARRFQEQYIKNNRAIIRGLRATVPIYYDDYILSSVDFNKELAELAAKCKKEKGENNMIIDTGKTKTILAGDEVYIVNDEQIANKYGIAKGQFSPHDIMCNRVHVTKTFVNSRDKLGRKKIAVEIFVGGTHYLVGLDAIRYIRREPGDNNKYLYECEVTADSMLPPRETRNFMEPRRIIYNDPATIVFWEDGTKTVVMKAPGEKFNKYAAFCAAVAKRLYITNSRICTIVKDGFDQTAKKETKKVAKKNSESETVKPETKKTLKKTTKKKEN